jgi:hypothetical protein
LAGKLAQLISDNDKPLAYGYVHDRDFDVK